MSQAPKARVLIVDDEVLVRDLYQAWLQAAGYETLTAERAADAQALLQEQPVDIVVTDIRMARQSGIDLLAWLQERDPTIPVILVTGFPAVESAVAALRLKAFDYLVKPVEEATLLHSVEQALAYRRLLQEKQRLEEENRRYQEHLETLVAQRTAALERRTQQLTLLHHVAQAIGLLQSEEMLFEQVTRLTQQTFGYMSVSVYTPDVEGQTLHLRSLHLRPEFQHLKPETYSQAAHEGLVGQAFRERRIIVANDVRDWPAFKPISGLPIRSEAVFPILLEGEVVAVLNVNQDTYHAFDETDRLVLETLADYLRIAIHNARLYTQAQEALALREEMLNNVSHELRTPLTIIRGYAELILEDESGRIPEDVRGIANTILEQTQLLAHQVDQLVTMRRATREPMLVEDIPYSDWLRHAVTPWRPVLEEVGLRLEMDIPPDLGYVRGHSTYLTRVMHNLLDNARKFSPKGGTVRVRAWREGAWIYTAVSDQGMGVPKDKLKRIFERFYQVDGSTKRRFGGMGLGLALVKEVVTRHGGEVWAESTGVGQGLTVIFRLPAQEHER